MKKEELFDLITELKVDDKFIEEALGTDLDGRSPVKVYAGNTKRSPMKIIAPVAACLAVMAGAGIVLANNIKLPVSGDNGPGASASTTQTSTTESTTSSTAENSEPGYTFIDYSPFPSQNKEFVDMCKNVVTSKFAQTLPDNVTWQEENMDVDFDGRNELLLCPWANNKSIKGVGVCVFERGVNDKAIYLGSFGRKFSTMDIKNFFVIKNDDTEDILYFNNDEENGICVDSIQKLSFDKDTNTIQEQTYLRLEKTYSDAQYTETAYRYGSEISKKELLDEWSSLYQKDVIQRRDIVPLPNVSDPHSAAAECVRVLVDKYDVPLSGGSPASLHRTVQSFDINGDGKEETIIEFRRCEQLPGIYVFSSDGELIGELDLEGERGTLHLTGSIDSVGRKLYNGICKYENGDESFYYYHSTHIEERTYHGYAGVAKSLINKIVVNEDGTLSSEAIVESGCEFISDKGTGSITVNRVNGKNVSSDECYKEEIKYPGTDYTFIW